MLTKIGTIVLRVKILLDKITSFSLQVPLILSSSKYPEDDPDYCVCGSRLKVDGFYFSFYSKIYLFRFQNR